MDFGWARCKRVRFFIYRCTCLLFWISITFRLVRKRNNSSPPGSLCRDLIAPRGLVQRTDALYRLFQTYYSGCSAPCNRPWLISGWRYDFLTMKRGQLRLGDSHRTLGFVASQICSWCLSTVYFETIHMSCIESCKWVCLALKRSESGNQRPKRSLCCPPLLLWRYDSCSHVIWPSLLSSPSHH